MQGGLIRRIVVTLVVVIVLIGIWIIWLLKGASEGFNVAFQTLVTIIGVIAVLLQWFFPFPASGPRQGSEVSTEALRKSTKRRLDAYYRGKAAVIMPVGANLNDQEFELYKGGKRYQRSNPGGKQMVKSAKARSHPEGNGIYAVVFDGIEPDDYVIEWENRSWGVQVEPGEVREVTFG